MRWCGHARHGRKLSITGFSPKGREPGSWPPPGSMGGPRRCCVVRPRRRHGRLDPEITEDPEPLLEWATRIAGRYVGAERAEEYGNTQPGELLVRITPNHVVAQADIAD